MKRLYVVMILAMIAQTHVSFAVMCRSHLLLVRSYCLCKADRFFTDIKPKPNNFQDQATGVQGSTDRPVYLPFDRHTAARILSERRNLRGQGRK